MKFAFNWKAFRALVESQDKSAEEIAKCLEVTVATVHNYKAGRSTPSTNHMGAISKFFNVRLDDLYISLEDFALSEEQVEKAKG